MVRIRKIVAVAAVLCMFPMSAQAATWTLNTWVKSAGGTMQSPNVAGDQTSVNGSVTRSYTTTTPLSVTVTPNAGYRISNLTKNGIIQTLADPTAVYTTSVLGPPNQSVQATFARISYTLSAVAGANGTVSPASISPVFSGGQSPARVFTYTPASGYSVLSIDVPGHLLNTDYQLLDAATNAPVTLPAATNVRVKVSIVNVNGSSTLMGTFGVVGANAGAAQTVLAGVPVLLDGSASTGATSYAWSQVSGPASVTLSGANTSQATFTAPATLGSYVFRLTINGGSTSTTIVQVTDSFAQAARNQCINCHGAQGVGAGIYDNWSSSGHKSKAVMCYTCHVGTNTGAHPGTLNAATVDARTFNFTGSTTNFCVTCHNSSIPSDFAAFAPHVAAAGTNSCSFCHNSVHNPNAACVNCHTPGNPFGLPWPPTGLGFHNDFTGTDLCVNCHNLHNPAVVTGVPFPHFSTYTTAQFVTANYSCDTCHNQIDQDNVQTFFVYSTHMQFARSSKGNPRSPAYVSNDFKTMGSSASPANSAANDCVRCHTTTGFVNYVNSGFTDIHAWGVSGALPGGDRTREMIQCAACHNPTPFISYDRSTDVDYLPAFSRRTMPSVTAYYNYSAPVSGRILNSTAIVNTGDSNMCIVCHAGRAAGTTLKAIGTRVGTTGGFWSNAAFINPHFMTGAGTLNKTTGFTYRASSFYLTQTTHATIGDAFMGSCVSCHMQVDPFGSPDAGGNVPSSGKDHLFTPVVKDSTGVIVEVPAFGAVCANCHPNSRWDGTAADFELHRQHYLSSLRVLAAVLANTRGIYFNPTKDPYFFTNTSYTTPVTNWGDMNTMGAAFNLQLLWNDRCGYSHNGFYVKRLLYDSIDFLDGGPATPANGQNNSVFTTIQNLQDFASAGFSLTAADRANAIAYITPRQ